MPFDPDKVYERMDRELLVNTYWQSNGLLMFKRAKKYFPIIEPILKKRMVFRTISNTGSHREWFDQCCIPAESKRHVWQIMPATARVVNGEVMHEKRNKRHPNFLVTVGDVP
jgi:hypothetical protein